MGDKTFLTLKGPCLLGLSLINGQSRCRFRPSNQTVTFEGNILLDLSGGAVTKTFCLLMMELLLQVLGQSTRAMAIRVIRGDEGVGDIPGVRGVQGSL